MFSGDVSLSKRPSLKLLDSLLQGELLYSYDMMSIHREDLKNEDNLRNVDDLKNKDNLKNKENLKNKGNLKN